MKTIEVLDVILRRKGSILFSLILLFVMSATLSAQTKSGKFTITGTVTDASLYPVPNAIVLIDGRLRNSLTDADGKYKVRAGKDAERICILTHENGFLEVPISGKKRINFQFGRDIPLKPHDLKVMKDDEVVNIGYDTIKKNQVATQVTKINGTSVKHPPYSDIYEMIRDKVAGVRVNGKDIIINGSDYYFDSAPPLLVVDGTNVSSLSGIPPSSVSSVEVLKNASTTIYGTRGYGGVIIVTTTKDK